MTPRRRTHDPIRARDRALRVARGTTRVAATGALALTGALSLVAAHAVRGHAATPAPATTPAHQGVTVAPPQQVPTIDGAPPAPQPPAQAPRVDAADVDAADVDAADLRAADLGARPRAGARPRPRRLRRLVIAAARWCALGTTAEIRCPDWALEQARGVVEDELAAIDAAASRFRDDSELTAVNCAGGRLVTVGPLLAEAIEAALWTAAATGGTVDPTIGRALVLAGYDRDSSLLRPSSTPLRAQVVTGWRAVSFDRRAATVRLPAGVMLDLGASAKALAADRAARFAAEQTGAGVLVNLGGDVSVAGPVPDGGWSIRACEDHRSTPDAPGQTVTIASGGLATSSTTTRRWRRGQTDAHHIIDPARGLPAEVVWRTVTVAAISCVHANAASTAAIVLGDDALDWLTRAGLPARLVAADGRVRTVGDWPAADAIESAAA